jgi:hypothetical protein
MGIFSDNALKYFETGIPVIPLKGKVPIVTGWQEWSTRPQTEDELERLIEQFPNANIGAVMGLWAVALDIDTDEEAVLRTVPYTPIRRRGKKGHVGIYAANALLNNPGTEFPVELLNHGRQIVLPPSIHPETKEPYHWTGDEDVFTFQDYPSITQENIRQIELACRKHNIKRQAREFKFEGQAVHLTDAGRNNYLTRVAYAMACDGAELGEITERLIYLDVREHDVAWFSDPTEPHRGKNPRLNAEKMAKRAIDKAVKKGERREHFDLVVDLKTVSPSPSLKPDLPIPKPRGMMRLFVDYCNHVSSGNQDALGLGGAIALMGVLASNRFRTQWSTYDVRPNIYVINLASSGFGKETPQKLIDDLLIGTGLTGSANYKSGSSLVMGLSEQQTRLDVVDECSSLLKSMTAREDYKSEIVEILSTLYSKSDGYFYGFTSMGNKKNFGACWNPCVNILGSTTPAGFRSSVNREMAAKGLLPRFLIFWQKELGEFKRIQNREAADKIMVELKKMVAHVLSIEYREHPEQGSTNLLESEKSESKRYDPILIPMTHGAKNMMLDIRKTYHDESGKNQDGFDNFFKNRFAQHVSKLALLDAIGLGLDEIGVDSVEWAYGVVKWQWELMSSIYEETSSENPHEKNVLRVQAFIKSKGSVKKSQITKRFRGIPGFVLKGILQQLVDGGTVTVSKEKLEDSKPGFGALIYSINE